MAVGKAEAQPPDKASTTGFSFVVPCVSEIDEARIRDYLARDEFFWLDLAAPSKEDVDKPHELFGFHTRSALVVVGASLIEAASTVGESASAFPHTDARASGADCAMADAGISSLSRVS